MFPMGKPERRGERRWRYEDGSVGDDSGGGARVSEKPSAARPSPRYLFGH